MNPLMQQMRSWFGPNAKVIRALAAPLGHVAMPEALPELNVPAELDPHNKPVPEREIFD
jgi:hypothetical protein